MSKTTRFTRYLERHRNAAGEERHDPPRDAAAPAGSRRAPRTFTLDDAFSFYVTSDDCLESSLNLERAVRSVAFLLHWCSQAGNEPVEGL
jgi:hypothetical protein